METSKKDIRRQMIRDIRTVIGPSPTIVMQRVCSLDAYKNADLILGYVPMKSEVDISLVMDKAIEDGKSIAFPDPEPGLFRLAGADWRDHLMKLQNKTSTMDDTAGILNFKLSNCNIAENRFKKGIILVPGLAFTEFGTRLGRGAGYYDQLLEFADSSRPDFITIGICRSSQLVAELPQQPHDHKVNMVIVF